MTKRKTLEFPKSSLTERLQKVILKKRPSAKCCIKEYVEAAEALNVAESAIIEAHRRLALLHDLLMKSLSENGGKR